MVEFPIAWRLQVQGAQDVKNRLSEINQEFAKGNLTTEQYTQKLRQVNRDATALNSSVRIQTNLWRAQHPVLATVERSLGRVAGIARSVQSAVNTFSLLRIAASGSSQELTTATDELSRAERNLAEARKLLAEHPGDPALEEKVAEARDKLAEATNRYKEANNNIDQQKMEGFVGAISSIAAIGGDISFAAFGLKQMGLNKAMLGRIINNFPITKFGAVVTALSGFGGITGLGLVAAEIVVAAVAIDTLATALTGESPFQKLADELGLIKSRADILEDLNKSLDKYNKFLEESKSKTTPGEISFGKDRVVDPKKPLFHIRSKEIESDIDKSLKELEERAEPMIARILRMLGLDVSGIRQGIWEFLTPRENQGGFRGSRTRGMIRNTEQRTTSARTESIISQGFPSMLPKQLQDVFVEPAEQLGDRFGEQADLISINSDEVERINELYGNKILPDGERMSESIINLANEFISGKTNQDQLNTALKNMGLSIDAFSRFVRGIRVTRRGSVYSEAGDSVGDALTGGGAGTQQLAPTIFGTSTYGEQIPIATGGIPDPIARSFVNLSPSGSGFMMSLLGKTKPLAKSQFDAINRQWSNSSDRQRAYKELFRGMFPEYGFKHGGILPENIFGMGESGRTYQLHEGETVTPSGKGGITINIGTVVGTDRRAAKMLAEMVSDEITAKLGPIGL